MRSGYIAKLSRLFARPSLLNIMRRRRRPLLSQQASLQQQYAYCLIYTLLNNIWNDSGV